jgi:hypothetical protein
MVAVELECSKKQPKLFYNTWFLYSRRRNKLPRRQGLVEPCSKTLHRQIVPQRLASSARSVNMGCGEASKLLCYVTVSVLLVLLRIAK